jgi:hypothetical protein
MKKKNITAIAVASNIKILIGIYAWFNFLGFFPGNFKTIVMFLFLVEFIEHIFINIHKERHKNNFWEANVNYNTMFYVVLLDLAAFWSVYVLVCYSFFIFRLGWFSGIFWMFVGIVCCIIIFYWITKIIVVTTSWLINQIKQTKLLFDSIFHMNE